MKNITKNLKKLKNMKNSKQILLGLIVTILIYTAAIFSGNNLHLKIDFIPDSFVTHTVMIILSFIVIYLFKETVNYRISVPKFKQILKPILFGFLATVIVNITMSIIMNLLASGNGSTGGNEAHPLLTQMSPFQVFLFVFIYASIAEEILYRGFLLNILSPLKTKGILIFKRKVSVSVMRSAVIFGLSHLILMTIGAGGMFLVKVVVFTTILGLIAGYYQEKYENNALAIIVHMAGNILSIVGVILMSS